MPERKLSKEDKASFLNDLKAGIQYGELSSETRKAIKAKHGIAYSTITYELNKLPRAQGGNKENTLSDAASFAKEQAIPTIEEKEEEKEEAPNPSVEEVKQAAGNQEEESKEDSPFGNLFSEGLPKEIADAIINLPFDLAASLTKVEEWRLTPSEKGIASAGYSQLLNQWLEQLLKGKLTPAKVALITTILLVIGKADAIKKTVDNFNKSKEKKEQQKNKTASESAIKVGEKDL